MTTTELALEMEEFLVWMSAERGRSRNTVQAYRRDLRQYQQWLLDRGSTVMVVATADLSEFVAERMAAG